MINQLTVKRRNVPATYSKPSYATINHHTKLTLIIVIIIYYVICTIYSIIYNIYYRMLHKILIIYNYVLGIGSCYC